MITLEVKVRNKPSINLAHLNTEAALLADRVAGTVTNYTKLAIVSFGAIATGETLRSVKWIQVANRNAAFFGVAATGSFRRQVVANRALKFIVSGRKAGKKMPVRMVGTGPRGGKIFEPLPAMKEWFEVLNIPSTAWFPILRKIARDGIPPKPVPKVAVRDAMPTVNRHAALAAASIARGLIKYGGR